MIDATPLLKAYAALRRRHLARLDPVACQRRLLTRLIERARATRFGADHRFSTITSVETFQSQVPIRRYEDLWQRYWQPAFPRDGILDARQELFEIRLDAEAAGRTLVIRATDALGNIGTGQVQVRLP